MPLALVKVDGAQLHRSSRVWRDRTGPRARKMVPRQPFTSLTRRGEDTLRSSLPAIMLSAMTAPQGRRPVGYAWDADRACWASYTTGEPLDDATYMEGVRARRRACDRRRYWDESTGVRQRRKLRARVARKRPLKPVQGTLDGLLRRRRAAQLTLDHAHSEAPETGGLKKPDVKE